MPAGRTQLLAVLLLFGAVLHFAALSQPRRVVFDEVHFGGFASAYCGSGRYFFDIHPPHAKLLIAGAAALGGYRGEQRFEELNEPFTAVSPALLRSVPAIAGTLLPLVLFGLMLQLGASLSAAFLCGLAVLLDNAVLVQTRIIALDGLLLVATFGALSAALAALGHPGRLRRTGFALLAGALAGLAAGTKLTGLVALGLVGLCVAVRLLPRPTWPRFRLVASVSVWVLSGAVAVYAAGWALHFALLTEPGHGYLFARPSGDFLPDTVQLHRVMLASNYGLTASHPDSSPWWGWPWMIRPVFYWSEAGASLYFLGNPIVWWGSALGLILVVGNLALTRVTDLRLPGGKSPWPRLLWIPAAGYLMALGPLVPVPRALFLYHYLTPLLFSLCLVLLWLDHVGWTRPGSLRAQRTSVRAAAVALVLGFLAISPFTFAFVNAPAYQAILIGALSR